MVFAVYGSVLSLPFIVSWATIPACDFIITEGQLFVKELADLLENRKKMPPYRWQGKDRVQGWDAILFVLFGACRAKEIAPLGTLSPFSLGLQLDR